MLKLEKTGTKPIKRQVYRSKDIRDSLEGSISAVIIYLQELQKENPSCYIELGLEPDYGGDRAYAHAIWEAEETDEELGARLAAEVRSKKLRRESFENLKKEFGEA